MIPTDHDLTENGTDEAPPVPTILSSAPDVAGLVKALRRRWLLATSIGVVCAVTAGLSARLLVPVKYTARALLDVAANPPKVIFNTNENRGDPFQTYQRKQAALIKTRLLLATALRQPKVAELSVVRQQVEPVEWLEKQIQADYSTAPDILRIAMSGDHPEELVVLVDAVTEAYLQEVVNKEQKRRLERLDQLKELYNRAEDSLHRKRQALRDLAESAGSSDSKTLALKHRFAIEQLAMAEKELMELHAQLRKLQVEAADDADKAKALAELPIPDSMLDEYFLKDPVVQRSAKKVLELEEQTEGLKLVYRDQNGPAIRQHQANIESAKAALASRREELRPDIIEKLRARAKTDLEASLALLHSRIARLKGHEKVLSEVIDRLRDEAQSMNRSGLSLGSLQDDIPRAENLVKTVAAELDALNVELQAPPRVTLIESAGIGPVDNRRQRILAAATAASGALFLALFAVAWREFHNRRVSTIDQVVHGLGMSFLGAVPHVPETAQRSLVLANGAQENHWQDLLSESVNAIRTMVMHAARVQPPLKVVMVTSAMGGEGKTSLSSHLAISLARAGRKTLLIDNDLRRPAVHRLFNLSLNPGLSEVLCSQIDLPSAIQATALSDLSILTAGRFSNGACEALAREGTRTIFDHLREQFEFVVVDSCPVLPVADSLLISQHVDGVIFTLLRDVSRLPQVYAGYQRLAALGMRMLGIVVNGADADPYGYSYSGYQYASPLQN